ncbi:MAG: hypothetical protein KAU02_03730 [Tenericutes bacterium]|nr:hypothetical protein [Mycoplasmatota bacterium]
MTNILVCVNDGLLKIRIQRILVDTNFAYTVTENPVKRDDLSRYDIVIIHSSYKLPNLFGFIENAVLQKVTSIIYLTTNVSSHPFRKFKDHINLISIDENKMDVALPITISLFNKYSAQIKELSDENFKLNKSLEEIKLMSACKKKLIKKGLSEDEAHKYILKYAMDNNLDKIETCNRLLVSNSD